jgi:hypothetical protein
VTTNNPAATNLSNRMTPGCAMIFPAAWPSKLGRDGIGPPPHDERRADDYKGDNDHRRSAVKIEKSGNGRS